MAEEKQRYRVIEKIDAGGMAEVYRGVAESIQGFKRAVAIKRILSNLSKNKKFITMFLDEAKLSLQLQHANIVQVYDIGVADSYFIVMELIDGANLKTIIDVNKRHSRRIPLAQSLYVIMQVCNGLHYAHNAKDAETGRPLGIVHRDISPPNILLSREGEVKLVDFGLAKAASQVENTEPGVVKGKFSYLAPEAVEGAIVDRRADIFACGVLLWELLTGRRLFYGETDFQTVEMVRQARIPSIAAINPEVEPELEAIVLKALARTPDTRYQYAADLGDALAQYLFSRGLKVTIRDIGRLVSDAIAEKSRGQEPARKPANLIDALIQEEILKFTSIDALDNAELAAGSPQTALGASPPPVGGDSFVDPRAWVDETPMQPVATPKSPGGTTTLGVGPSALPRVRSSAQGPAVAALATGIADEIEPDAPAASRSAARQAPAARMPVGVLIVSIIIFVLLGALAALFVIRSHMAAPKSEAPAAGSPK